MELSDLRFDPAGTLVWGEAEGSWRTHGGVLYVEAAGRSCEGAIDSDAVYLLCEFGGGPEGRTQMVMTFVSDATDANETGRLA